MDILRILVELEDEILVYQRDSNQFRESNGALEATCTPVQLIKDGDRPISHKMAYALAERFAMEPSAFLSTASAKVTAHIETVPLFHQ
ncbi:hypothetical protein ACNT2N_24855 [Pseudomonas thivervalensis]|uniref:hypothetical protein n=1 Tax=Pseudomonas thivervalensis TaxID=86265 RepID=UPI0020966F94|nr:hypothetical protein [Pseudomonas thivervalensis]